jgi:hypothetical protein
VFNGALIPKPIEQFEAVEEPNSGGKLKPPVFGRFLCNGITI